MIRILSKPDKVEQPEWKFRILMGLELEAPLANCVFWYYEEGKNIVTAALLLLSHILSS